MHKNLDWIKYQLCGPWNDKKLVKSDDKINILGICEWLFIFCKGLPWLMPYLPRWKTLVNKVPYLLLHKNLEWIKYNLCVPWNDEKVIKKTRGKNILGSCKWFLKFAREYIILVRSCLSGWHLLPKNLNLYYRKTLNESNINSVDIEMMRS